LAQTANGPALQQIRAVTASTAATTSGGVTLEVDHAALGETLSGLLAGRGRNGAYRSQHEAAPTLDFDHV
jgi:hypothetical protein